MLQADACFRNGIRCGPNIVVGSMSAEASISYPSHGNARDPGWKASAIRCTSSKPQFHKNPFMEHCRPFFFYDFVSLCPVTPSCP
jgi:hypothetical protein